MKDQRSGSQILWGFLPEQTGDLKGGIFRTVEWKNPVPIDVEDSIIRRRLTAELDGWVRSGADASIARQLHGGAPIEVVSVNRDQGVRVERFPEVWVCSVCRRVERGRPQKCAAGHERQLRQLHFVGYHECGRLEAPYIPRCRVHNQVRMPPQKSMDASKLEFDCPICHAVLQKGLGMRPCPCGQGYSDRKGAKMMSFNVHRAAIVYTPQTFVMVNPASRAKTRHLMADGGPRQALTWALGGFDGTLGAQQATASTLIATLIAQGMPRAVAEQMAAVAQSAGSLAAEEDLGSLAAAPEPVIVAAENAAVDVALATIESRIRIPDLITPDAAPDVRMRYERDYPAAILRSGLSGIDLVDRFPVLKAVYGFTRGGLQPGEARLNRFHGKGGNYRVYADLQQAEALMFQLEPTKVSSWLIGRGHKLTQTPDARSARAQIAGSAGIPSHFDEPSAQPTLGEDLLTLTHSMSHRAIRQLAVFAGVDREGLGEYLVPEYGVFFVFAATRGDFVLGGIQAVFENDLDSYLNTMVGAESRCPLDPACGRNGGACHACMHLGEPTCDYFNRFLDRRHLFGPDGYLAAHPAQAR